MTVSEILARNAHPSIRLRAGRVEDHVVVGAQIVDGDVTPEFDAAIEPESRICRHLVEARRDRLDLLVIGRHAGPNQPVRRRDAVVHVDLDHESRLAEEVVGGVVSGRTGADDGDAEWGAFAAGTRHPARAAGLSCSAMSWNCRVSTSPW